MNIAFIGTIKPCQQCWAMSQQLPRHHCWMPCRLEAADKGWATLVLDACDQRHPHLNISSPHYGGA
jgi:hypothetical protein